MEIAYWIVAALLAVAFLGAGLMKLARPKEALIESGMTYAEDFSAGQMKLIGAAEVLGAVGLILPRLLDIAPVLSPIAAVALAALMIGAVIVHVRRKEAPTNAAVLAVLAAGAAVLGFLTLS